MSKQGYFRCSFLVHTSVNRTQYKTKCKKSFWKQLKKILIYTQQKKKGGVIEFRRRLQCLHIHKKYNFFFNSGKHKMYFWSNLVLETQL